jgi:hypothetical protein
LDALDIVSFVIKHLQTGNVSSFSSIMPYYPTDYHIFTNTKLPLNFFLYFCTFPKILESRDLSKQQIRRYTYAFIRISWNLPPFVPPLLLRRYVRISIFVAADFSLRTLKSAATKPLPPSFSLSTSVEST